MALLQSNPPHHSQFNRYSPLVMQCNALFPKKASARRRKRGQAWIGARTRGASLSACKLRGWPII